MGDLSNRLRQWWVSLKAREIEAPELLEAADEIERLEATLSASQRRVMELRTALREIVSIWNDDSTDVLMDAAVMEAKEALGDD